MTASANFVIVEGSKQLFSSSSIILSKVRFDGAANYDIEIVITDSSGAVYGGVHIPAIEDDLTAHTASGAKIPSQFYSLVEQTVKGYLESLTENSSVTFTI